VGAGTLLSVGSTATWPFYDENSNTLGSGGVDYPPIDLVGTNANNVNWGMLIFSSGIDDPNGEWFGTPSIQTKIIKTIDTSDTGDVAAIENALQLFNNDPVNGGVACWGSTPTRKGLDLAIHVLKAAAAGTTTDTPLTDDMGQSWTDIPPDPRLNCGRKYFNILVTDGISNFGNPGGCGGPPSNGWGNWPEPCLACNSGNCAGYNGGPGCPDGGPSGSTCPDDYTLFPAGKAEEAWNATFLDPSNNTRNLFTRTWVIGISQEVGPCELNATAYYGRTDANAPEGDGGYQTALDPRLPGSAPGTFDYVSPYCNPSGVKSPYAFFATDPTALQNALNFILRASLFGDFVTSGPSVANAFGGTGSLGLLASSAYPGFQGHLYAYDITHPVACNAGDTCPSGGACGSDGLCPAPDTYLLSWEAGEVVSQGPDRNAATTADNNNGLARRIYTWDGNQLVVGTSTKVDSLVEITSANQGTLNNICGACGLTGNVIDFIRGNDGNGNPRPWVFGGVWNSNPAVIGAPEVWTQFNNHIDFETAYKNRRGLVWVGSSDGMVHAFDIRDGTEILALIPPDMLSRQIKLYNTYLKDPVHNPLGQDSDPTKHIWGMASAVRFADIWDNTIPSYKYPGDPTKKGGYRTVMFLTEGGGGHGLHAIDVTHAWWRSAAQHDPFYGFTELQVGFTAATGPQVMPLWSRTEQGTNRTETTSNLAQTWSIPAVGAMNNATAMGNGNAFLLVMGSGFRAWADPLDVTSDKYKTQPKPYLMRFNALKGNRLDSVQLSGIYASALPFWVRDQAVADGVIWGTSSPYYRPDNDNNQGVVADYHGQVWLYKRQGASTNWNNPVTLPDASNLIVGNPIYYSPAVAPYPAISPAAYLLYAFGSGSFYESSPLVTGASVGTSGHFIPALYIAAQNVQSSAWVVKRVNIQSLTYAVGSVVKNLSGSAQLTTSPLLLTPAPGLAGNAIALFSVYDPNVVDPSTGVCGGSYVIEAQFNPANLSQANPFTWDVAPSGAGASAGFALGGSNVPLAAMSTTVSNSHAYLNRVTGISIQTFQGSASPIVWWMELQ
jgi:hypothetical protein